MSTDSLAVFVRLILKSMGVPEHVVRDLTAHSMKVTTLSWCAKAGINDDCRRRLGGHSKPGDQSLDLYSRDLLSEPLRQLGHVLLWIKHKKFQPDNVRAERWNGTPGESVVDLSLAAGAAGRALRARAKRAL